MQAPRRTLFQGAAECVSSWMSMAYAKYKSKYRLDRMRRFYACLPYLQSSSGPAFAEGKAFSWLDRKDQLRPPSGILEKGQNQGQRTGFRTTLWFWRWSESMFREDAMQPLQFALGVLNSSKLSAHPPL